MQCLEKDEHMRKGVYRFTESESVELTCANGMRIKYMYATDELTVPHSALSY